MVCIAPSIIKRMEKRFVDETFATHALIECPSVVIAAIPPIVYMNCKSSICAFVEREVALGEGEDITLENLQECNAIIYTIKPLTSLILGFAVLRGLFGPWYKISKAFKVEVVSSGQGLTKLEFFECFLFFVSAGIAIVMFGLTTEHREEGEIATSAMTVFSFSFLCFIISQMVRIFRFELGEMKIEQGILDSGGTANDLEQRRHRASSRSSRNMVGEVDFNPGFY